MDIPSTHRKTIRHFDFPGHAHALTFSCYQRWPLLEDDDHRALLSHAVTEATRKQHFQLLAFVWMPEHVHLLVFPKSPQAGISDLLFAIKRPFSYRVKKRLEEKGDQLLERLTVLERPGKRSFRFWQEGPGYDRNITGYDELNDVIEYFHLNPVRRGLCLIAAEYPWSSWRQYHEPDGQRDPMVPRIERLVRG